MVTGAPAKMLDRREELTPMLSQYVDLAETYDDAIVLFRVGDFFKAFCETADEVARICELTRIEREDSTGTYTACGIPVGNAASYLDRLLAEGYRLAVADQVEDPEETTGLVDRAVTRIVTPGTVVDEELLVSGSTNYVACLAGGDGESRGLAYIDVSTGECAVTSGSHDAISEELDRVDPAELLRRPAIVGAENGDTAAFDADCPTTDYDADAFDPATARNRLDDYTAPDRFDSIESVAVGALLAYAEYTQGDDGPLEYVTHVRRYDPRRSLRLDGTALRGLELFESHTESGRTLLETVDETRSALGRRRLESWLRRPLVDRERIEARHEAVGALADAPLVRAEIRELFDAAYDLERLVGRVSRERADARDLRSLHDTLAVVPKLREAIADIDALGALYDDLDPLADLREFVDDAVVTDPPQEITDGGVIREGYDEQLDDLRTTAREGREWIADLEASERERTGIDNLEVGYTQVHGYYIEVTNSHLDEIPENYTRRQTLKNAERFYTPELKRREDEIVGAEERADALEYELFGDIRQRVAAESERIQSLADAIARLDALAGLATVAVEQEYTRPEMCSAAESTDLEIERGRHPVVERTESEFVPNDATLPRGSVTLLTGPNMSGKSTYMRAIALTVVLAQAGSFVPADAARVPVTDRVFTRVGASDDIAGGQSTFMREMAELTDILHDATGDSLVLLDEVGRGTSTADGQAIARAAVEFLHDELGATTIFATHYHDLTELANRLDSVHNRHFVARREDGEVTFLHRVRDGPASSSYGVEVAEMAGVPPAVVDRARELVAAGGAEAGGVEASGAEAGGVEASGAEVVESGESSEESDSGQNGQRQLGDLEIGDTTASGSGRGTAPTDGTASADSIAPAQNTESAQNTTSADVLTDLADVDIARTTPVEALTTLQELQRRLDDSTTEADDR
jgi:DNA mismatch repair protein MutS